ncbi:BZ3500_MvSof-1268-A1-R1_Chr1-3g01860 [Microbotryum saponariae]|uniref:BZ3500_MvSof-1268-A1-R1_Chr1-3g01860 protein n=1 Tax=Microbotryum saponariae TaxID=289078 RepID=A0A2X0KD00_9BASI|nr:BZ3500_MvSof-1268-A1-R1_Chr1-3g01860 [Microbotryum saponariae]SCZ94751.1 BZ3501_MvSof-1269-A2-R1_Chr1-3g01462 [Microbotryum saponariae]
MFQGLDPPPSQLEDALIKLESEHLADRGVVFASYLEPDTTSEKDDDRLVSETKMVLDESYSFSSWRVSPRLRKYLVGEETERKAEGKSSTKSEQGREGPLVQRWCQEKKKKEESPRRTD